MKARENSRIAGQHRSYNAFPAHQKLGILQLQSGQRFRLRGIRPLLYSLFPYDGVEHGFSS